MRNPGGESLSRTISVRLNRSIFRLLEQRAEPGGRSAVVEMALRYFLACEAYEEVQRVPLEAWCNGFTQGFDTAQRAILAHELTPHNVDEVLAKYLTAMKDVLVRFPERTAHLEIPERMRVVAARIESDVRAARRRERR